MADSMHAHLGRLSLGGGLPTDGEMTHVARPSTAREWGAPSIGQRLRGAIGRADDEAAKNLVSQASIAELNETFGPHKTPILVDVAANVPNPERLVSLLRLLIDHGASPMGRDDVGMDALMTVLARRDEPLDAATLLLRRGADARHTNARGESPLHLLLRRWRRHQAVVLQMLLRRKVDLFMRAPEGVLPLWLAACSDDAPTLVGAMLRACPENRRTDFVRAESWHGERKLGNAGTAALLFQADDEVAEILLMQLGACGLNLLDTEAQACAMPQQGTVGRSFQDYMDRCRSASARMAARQAPWLPPPAAVVAPAPVQPPLPPARTSPILSPRRSTAPERTPVPTMPSQGLEPRRASDEHPQHPAPSPQLLQDQPPPARSPLSAPPAHEGGDQEPEAGLSPPLGSPEAEVHRPPVSVPVLTPEEAQKYQTRSIYQVARSGPIEAFAPVIAMNPEALIKRDHLRDGGHMPIALAVLSREAKHVTLILEALKAHGYLSPEVLDAPGTDGRCALSLAIDLNGQRQVLELIQAGASPRLPIPQPIAGLVAGILRPFTRRPAKNAAEYAVQICKPYILAVLLLWDERDAARRQSFQYTFDLARLTALAQAGGSSANNSAIRDVLENAAARRRRGRRPQP